MAALDDILRPVLGRVSLGEIARLSGQHVQHLYEIRAGRKVPTGATVARVRFAVARLKMRQVEQSDVALTACYRMALAIGAVAMGLEPDKVQQSDPALKRSTNKEWRDAAMARQLALYLMNTGLGYKQSEVARAAGVTKQAINQALGALEDRREDPNFDALCVKLEGWILGAAA